MDTPAFSDAAVRGEWSPPFPDASGFEHAMIETPGLRTHVASIGQGEPVIMLHGFPQHWWEWRRVAPLIAAGGHRVICPDLRLFGWSEADEPKLDRTTMMRDIVAVLDASASRARMSSVTISARWSPVSSPTRTRSGCARRCSSPCRRGS